MRPYLQQVTDANGNLNALTGGVGFLIEPAAPPAGSSGVVPGSFISGMGVKFDEQSGVLMPVTNSRKVLLSDVDRFRSMQLLGAPAKSAWNVWLLERRDEELLPSPAKSRVQFNAQAPTAIATAAPVNGDLSGIKIWPGYRVLSIQLTGTAQNITLWQQTVSGNWIAAEVIDSTVPNAVPGMLVRAVSFGGGRLYLQAPAGGTLAEIDIEAEI